MNSCLAQLNENVERQQQSTAELFIFLDRESIPMSCNFQSTICLNVWLITPNPQIRQHKSHVVLQKLTWRMTIMDFLLELFMFEERETYLMLLYVPHPARLPGEAVERLPGCSMPCPSEPRQWQCRRRGVLTT